MKHLFACALAGVLCLAAASAHAQTAKRTAPPTKWQAHFGVISGATTAIQGQQTAYTSDPIGSAPPDIYEREKNQGTAALVAGVLGVTRAMSPRARLGADVYLGWTDTAFRTDSKNARIFLSNNLGSADRRFYFSDPVSYDFKTAINLRFFWDTQLRPMPVDVFVLAGYQFRRISIGITTVDDLPAARQDRIPLEPYIVKSTKEEIDHGYQIGLGADIGIIPSVPNLRWRLEYVFAENFGSGNYELDHSQVFRGDLYQSIDRRLSSHDINLGFVYRFNLGKRQKSAQR